ncbi:MAG: phosphomannomutase/phosphoglucomutase [Cocleimonas sp.]|jgi:phosphomannomutase/phosphoglucomutase
MTKPYPNSSMIKNIINKDIFKAYDIRGKVGTDWCLNENYNDAFLIGQALGSQLISEKSNDIIVGRDGRNSSESISENLILGLLSVGCNVTDIGLTATPIVYFCLDQLNIPNCAMVTGSHNPPLHNGIKMVTNRVATSQQMIESLYFHIIGEDFEGDFGTFSHYDSAITEYQKAIAKNINLNKLLRIGIDAGNGATALFAQSLFEILGCEVHPLFCEVDGNFPNHSPDPTTPENLESLIELVKENNLDIGIAFDGDGDRMIAIDNEGNLLWPDRILILLAQEILALKPNSRIVFDIKCSMLLGTEIRKAGGQAAFCPNGHSIMKREVLRLDAIMGGEFSGHIVLRDRWNDFDDAPYVAARFLEILSNTDKTCADVFRHIPDSFSTYEYKIKAKDIHDAAELVAKFIKNADFSGATLNTLDGLRVEYDDGWGLIRSSNTSASIGIRFEATSAERLKEIKQQFRTVFKTIAFEQELPF